MERVRSISSTALKSGTMSDPGSSTKSKPQAPRDFREPEVDVTLDQDGLARSSNGAQAGRSKTPCRPK